MQDSPAKSTLVLVGGHEDKTGHPDILRNFVACAGGREADIAVMTCASKSPRDKGLEYEVLLTKLGAARVTSIHANQCASAESLGRLKEVTGVLFIGGEPSRVIDAIKDTPTDVLLHERLESGLVLAGTSAGALMMPEIVIMDGESRTNPCSDTVDFGPGMGFLKDVVLDVHFAERGRCGRMLAALAKAPHCLGIALDEDAALVVRGDDCEVIGEGSVFLFDARTPEFADITPPQNKNYGLTGIRLHVLSAGCRFDTSSRTASCPHR